MPNVAAPKYDTAIARALAADITQLLMTAHAANGDHGTELVLDVIVNLAAGLAIDAGVNIADLCNAIAITYTKLAAHAAEQLLARTTTAETKKPV